MRKIFAWALEGEGGNEITRRLIAEGVQPPCRRNFEKGFNKSEKLLGSDFWKISYIKNLLSSRIYTGDMVQGKTRKVNGRQIGIAPSEWVCVENTHEPLISREDFQRVQELRAKAAKPLLEVAEPYSANVFKGKIFCAKCGQRLHRHRQNKDGTYWFRCESQWMLGKDACTVVSVKEADLKTEILAVLHKYAEAILGRYAAVKKEKAVSDINKDGSELREINRGLDRDGRMLKSLYESMVGGLITQDEFIKMKADYETKIEALSSKANEIRARQAALKSQNAEYSDFAEAVSAAIHSDTLTEEIIGRLVHSVHVRPDKSFHIQFRFKDEFTTEREVLFVG